MPEILLAELHGFEDLCQLFEQAPKRVVPGAVLAGLYAGGQVIEEAIVANVPVRDFRDGGDADYPALIEDLGTDVSLSADGRGGIAHVGFKGAAYVAQNVEYGHRMVTHQPELQQIGTVTENPFMRRSADASAEAAFDALEEAMVSKLVEGELLDG